MGQGLPTWFVRRVTLRGHYAVKFSSWIIEDVFRYKSNRHPSVTDIEADRITCLQRASPTAAAAAENKEILMLNMNHTMSQAADNWLQCYWFTFLSKYFYFDVFTVKSKGFREPLGPLSRHLWDSPNGFKLQMWRQRLCKQVRNAWTLPKQWQIKRIVS